MVIGSPHQGLFAVASREVTDSDRELNLHIVQAPPPAPRRDSVGPSRTNWKRRDERPVRDRREAALAAAAQEAVDAPGGVPRVSIGVYGMPSTFLSLDLAKVLKDPRLGDLPITVTFGETGPGTRSIVTKALGRALEDQPKLREKTITMPRATPKQRKTTKPKKPGQR